MEMARFISAGRFTATETWRHPSRTLAHDVLLLALHGCLHIAEDGQAHEMRFGDFVHLRAGVPHWGCQDDPDACYYWVHYLPVREGGVAAPPPLPDCAHGLATESALILFRQLLHFANRAEPDQALMDCMLTALLMELAHQLAAARPNCGRRCFAEVLEWVRVNLDHPITLKSAADEFHYNPKYFSRLFMREKGVCFSAYVQGMRLNRACGMLLNTAWNVTEVARRCGYKDEKYFMNVFRRHIGMTALAYRAGVRETHFNNR